MISGNVPKHLTVGVKTGFLTAFKQGDLPWRRVAMLHNMDAKSVDTVDLGAAPMPTQQPQAVQSFIEKYQTLKPVDWYTTVYITKNAVDDDQTGMLERRARQAGQTFDRHINKRVFTVLNGGDGSTYGACYDDSDFFDDDHTDPGADYQTNQDNENALTLSLDNFETVVNAARLFMDDRGEYTEYAYDLLVCHGNNERIAANICGNPKSYDTSNEEINPYSGKFDYVLSPHLDTTAWYVIASNEAIKPLIVAWRKAPALNAAWFDPQQAEGGVYYWQWHARYEIFYGDWRLASQGNT